ncbi:MAG: hypothetical protein J6B95_07955 [Oscillospiraceae bacterium]|nr:hypothetical protein [Oscillospiraceae bacterium]
MKRIYTALCGAFLLFLLLVGLISTFDKDATFSESERRQLKTRPKLTISSLLDGTYFIDYREYFADTFPGRESLMEKNVSLNNFYYFAGLGSEDNASLVVDFSSNAAQHGEALKDPDATTPTEETAAPEEEEKIPQQTEPAGVAEQLGSVVLIGDSAFDVPSAKGEAITRYAKAVSAIADTLGSGVRTISMPVPNSAEFYTKNEYHTGSHSQKAMVEKVRDNLGENVTYVDAYTEIAKHIDEYIYFRTDHHWTHLGAYYAYTALCETLGYEAATLDQFETGQWDNFVGSMYTYISNYPQAAVLKNNPDTVYYWKPFADCTTKYYSNTGLTDPVTMGTICKVREEVENKYLTFMGGDHPVTIVETNTNGPCILVIKESYGNALISWLTSNYSKIILIDPREYYNLNSDIDLKGFCEAQGVDQCLVINYPMMLNSDSYIGLLEKLTQ